MIIDVKKIKVQLVKINEDLINYSVFNNLSGRCDNYHGVKSKGSVGEGEIFHEYTTCYGMKKNL